jgi:hypothetical protein
MVRKMVRIEDIEGMRQREGIDDVELREAIRGLQVGDAVKLTLLADAMSPVKETLTVLITRIDGDAFQGKLAAAPTAKELSHLRRGFLVAFSPAHVHSVARKPMLKRYEKARAKQLEQ